MDWRLISAATLAGASFSMVAFGAYTLHAADRPDADRVASPASAPALMPVDVGGQPPLAVRSVTFAPVEGNGVAAMQNAAHSGWQVAPAEGTSVLAADLPALSKEQVKGVKVFWNHKRHGSWRVSHHARFCSALRPCEEKKLQQVQPQVAAVPVRHEEHSTPKVALMIGVGF
jgi:hypothetical protein